MQDGEKPAMTRAELVTLRDLFACHVLQGLYANSDTKATKDQIAVLCYNQADAMLDMKMKTLFK